MQMAIVLSRILLIVLILKNLCFVNFFSVYQEENCIRGNVRPEPVMLGVSQLLDLYQLFSLVKEKGGYAAVSRKGLWDSVIVDLGLDLNVLASVKLVYEKYLSDFEGWLSKTFEEKSFKNWNGGCLNSLPIDLEKELQSLSFSNLKDKDDHFVTLEPCNIIKHIDLVNHKSDGNLLDTKNQNNKCEGVQNFNGDGNEDDNEKFGTGVKDDLAASFEFHSRKRKRESLSEMINWMKNIAIHPFDPEEYKGGWDFFVQMLKARDVLSVRKHAEPNNGSSSKVKMHPLHDSVKPDAVVSADLIKPSWDDDSREKLVSVGRRFQAEVPQWTGVVYERDSKWLGTQVWPVKNHSKPTTETDLVGRGRRGKCSCNVQGSVDCVRLHIAANRTKLKFELGSAFYHWGFDKMGEEVSLRWTADEEKRFKDAMGLKIPSQNKSFWNNPSIYFQRKTRKDMVSYCFNVYLIQLRSYQNRVTQETVDSDYEEVEFGSFGDGFGRKAIKPPSMDFMECSENTQCFDFE